MAKPICVLLVMLLSCGAEAAEPHRVGKFTTTFDELHPLVVKFDVITRLYTDKLPEAATNYKAGEISHLVCVPKNYTRDLPHGLMVYISAGDGGFGGYGGLQEKYRMICVGPKMAGNKQSVAMRRLPLALDAVHNMRKLYNIDPERIYVSGNSGGGRCASSVAVNFSDVFSGGLYEIGANVWVKLPVPGGKSWWPASFRPPQKEQMAWARQNGRYVLLTGEKDFNKAATKAMYDVVYKPKFAHALYIEVPGMGHGSPPAEWRSKAFDFLDGPIIKKRNASMQKAVKAGNWAGAFRAARGLSSIAQSGTAEHSQALKTVEEALKVGKATGEKVISANAATMRNFVRQWQGSEVAKAVAGKCDGLGQKELDGILGAERVSPGALKRFLGTWVGFPVYDKALVRYDEMTSAHLEKVKAVPNKDARAKYLLEFARKWTPATCVAEALQLADEIANAEFEKVKQINNKTLRKSKLRAFARKYAGTKSAKEAESLLE